MTTPPAAGSEAEDPRRRQLALLAELREVEHWRRLVAARLDLAVAAVAAIDEPAARPLPGAPAPPLGLRDLLGLAPPGHAAGEAALALRLRGVQHELDTYAHALRATARGATWHLLSRLDGAGHLPPCAHDALGAGAHPGDAQGPGYGARGATVVPLRPREGGRRTPGGAARPTRSTTDRPPDDQ